MRRASGGPRPGGDHRDCGLGDGRTKETMSVPEAIYVDATDKVALGATVEQSDSVAVGPGLGTSEAAEELLGAALAVTIRLPIRRIWST